MTTPVHFVVPTLGCRHHMTVIQVDGLRVRHAVCPTARAAFALRSDWQQGNYINPGRVTDFWPQLEKAHG